MDQLVLYTATQMPHIVRTGLSECLGLDHGRSASSHPMSAAASDTGEFCTPKRSSLVADDACRQPSPLDRGPARASDGQRELPRAPLPHHRLRRPRRPPVGRLLGIDCEATVDSGAYSSYPFSACLEAAQVASILPGAVRFSSLSLQGVVGRHQQMPHPALPRRRAHGRLLRDGAGPRCDRKGGRDRAPRATLKESCSAGANAVRQHHQEAFRQRRLPRSSETRHWLQFGHPALRKRQKCGQEGTAG